MKSVVSILKKDLIVQNSSSLSFHRKRLFSMINDLPTLFEVASGRKAVKDKPSMDSGSKSRNSTKVRDGLGFFLTYIPILLF